MPTTPDVTSPTYYYTSKEHVERLISAKGVSLRLDHLSSGQQDTFWANRLAEVNGTIDSRLRIRYDHADLAVSSVVRWIATVICTYRLLLERNGSAGPIEDEYLHCMEELEKFRTGELLLPDTPLAAHTLPGVVNITVSPFTDSRTIVDSRTSSETARGIGALDRQDWYIFW